MNAIFALCLLTLPFALEATLSPLCKTCHKQPDTLRDLRQNARNEIVPETDFLLKLDKGDRDLYKSLDNDGQELSRRLAATSEKSDWHEAIGKAKEERERLLSVIQP